MTHRSLAVLVATLLLVSTVGPATAIGGDTTAQTQAEANGTVNVTVGQQLSTVMAETDGDVRTEVEETSFELEFESEGEDGKAQAIDERAQELAERAREIQSDYEEARRAHDAGEISDSEYAQRIAALNARADNLADSVERLRTRAAGVSALELRAEGYASADLRAIDERLEAVSGTGAKALLHRFTGQSDGEVRLDTAHGLTIEVEGEDGELSREIDRDRDEELTITISQEAALETARAELGSPAAGNWTLEKASVHDDSGYYKFEFDLTDANATGEAEVRIDGSSGEMFRLETDIEAEEDADDGDEADPEREDEADDDSGEDGDELVLLLSEGSPGPNETVTVKALAAGEPVANATVTVNDRPVGETDADGTLTLTLPREEAELTVESGDAEGELSFEFDEEERENEHLREHLDARATVSDGTTTLRVTFDGEPVENATVTVDGSAVGTTDADGTLSFAHENDSELDLTVQKGEFTASLEFERVADGSLALADLDTEVDDRDADESDETGETDEEDDERDDADQPDAEDLDDPESDGSEDSMAEGELDVSVVSGERSVGSTVTVELTLDDTAVEDATVFLNDDPVATTDADGRADVTLPTDDDVEIAAEYGDESADIDFDLSGEITVDETDETDEE